MHESVLRNKFKGLNYLVQSINHEQLDYVVWNGSDIANAICLCESINRARGNGASKRLVIEGLRIDFKYSSPLWREEKKVFVSF